MNEFTETGFFGPIILTTASGSSYDITETVYELNVYESDFKLDDILPDQLTTYAVEARYPDPENGISLEKAKDAIFIALEVRRRIL